MLRRLVRLYRTQVELIWRWRPGRAALIKRGLVALVAGVIAFWITAWLLPSLDIVEPGGALIAVVIISALNLLVRPVILAIVASRSVVALVILTLLFQAFVDLAARAIRARGRSRNGDPWRAHRVFRVRRHRRRHRPVVRTGRGRFLLRHARADAREPPPGCDPDRRAGPRDHPDRRPLPRRAVPRATRRPRAGAVALDPLRIAPARPLGRAAPVNHAREPGGHPPRFERRHPQLPLAGEGDRPHPRGEPPGGRHRDRGAHLRRRGAAEHGRRVHQQHLHG